MKKSIMFEEFRKTNKAAFLQATGGKKMNLPRSKPRSRAEFLAMGRIVVDRVRQAEDKGYFSYDSRKGITFSWKN